MSLVLKNWPISSIMECINKQLEINCSIFLCKDRKTYRSGGSGVGHSVAVNIRYAIFSNISASWDLPLVASALSGVSILHIRLNI